MLPLARDNRVIVDYDLIHGVLNPGTELVSRKTATRWKLHLIEKYPLTARGKLGSNKLVMLEPLSSDSTLIAGEILSSVQGPKEQLASADTTVEST